MNNSCGDSFYPCTSKNTCPDREICGIYWEESIVFPKQKELIKVLGETEQNVTKKED